MFEYRVTKYDQSQRNERGEYIGPSAWTCYSDVGKIFDGKVLTIDECLRVESTYIDVVTRLFEDSCLPYLRLTRVWAHEEWKNDMRSDGGQLYDPAFEAIDFTEDAKITSEHIPTVLQMIFRGFSDASLEWMHKFYVHIGWDFYMYVGTNTADSGTLDAVHSAGLYVDSKYPSPYTAFNLPTNILNIHRCRVGQDNIDESYEFNLTADYLEKLKPIWGFSEEHPFLGRWKIKPQFKKKIEKVVGQALSFEAYDYYIWTVD